MSNRQRQWINRLGWLGIGALVLAGTGYEYQHYLTRQAVLAVSNQLASAMNVARAEAIERGVIVTVCARRDHLRLSCGDENDWDKGWIVLVGDIRHQQISSERFAHAGPIQSDLHIDATGARVTYDWMGTVLTPPLRLCIHKTNDVKGVRLQIESGLGALSLEQSIVCT